MPKRCHICGRTSFNSESYVRCANVRQTLANGRPICTRGICRDCFDDYGWDFGAAAADPQWTCTHCREVCPKCALGDPFAAGGANAIMATAADPTGLRSQLQSVRRASQFWALLTAYARLWGLQQLSLL